MSTLLNVRERLFVVAACILCSIPAETQQPGEKKSPDESRFEITAEAWLQQPRGVIHGGNGNLNIDLGRDITFRGQTFLAGSGVRTEIRTFHFYPQYQWNFIQRSRGHLGLNIGIDLFDMRAKITALAGVSGPGGPQTVTRTAEGSLFAGLPTGGFEGRIFPIPGHDWFNINGHARGMYFFGYGKYVEARLNGEIRFSSHFGVQGGYQFVRETEIHNKASDVSKNQIGIAYKYFGPLFGLTARW